MCIRDRFYALNLKNQFNINLLKTLCIMNQKFKKKQMMKKVFTAFILLLAITPAFAQGGATVSYTHLTNVYLTSAKTYTIGTKNFGGFKGSVLFRKLLGSVNVRFQMYRSYDSAPISGNAFMNISDINNDIGYFPYQIALLHTENSTQHFPALLENNAIQIPQTSLTAMSTSYYTYGEVQGLSLIHI